MKKRKYDEDEPSDQAKIIPDFLPPPDQLIFPGEDAAKITLNIDLKTLAFFKLHARRHRTKYQRMIREVLRRYAKAHDPNQAA